MSFALSLRTGLLAAALVATSAGAAAAFPATATGNVNVRTGPGTNYAIVSQLHTGEHVDIVQCKSGWCYTEHSGPDGWVSANYLGQSGNYGGGSHDYRPSPSRPSVNFGFSFGNSGTGFGFSFGNGRFPIRQLPRVCFYDGNNYSGASFCVSRGGHYSRLGAWNNRISSIRIYGNASAQLCQASNYRNFCRTVSSSERALGPFLNNKSSSLRVY